jgi:hypothetical protein
MKHGGSLPAPEPGLEVRPWQLRVRAQRWALGALGRQLHEHGLLHICQALVARPHDHALLKEGDHARGVGEECPAAGQRQSCTVTKHCKRHSFGTVLFSSAPNSGQRPHLYPVVLSRLRKVPKTRLGCPTGGAAPTRRGKGDTLGKSSSALASPVLVSTSAKWSRPVGQQEESSGHRGMCATSGPAGSAGNVRLQTRSSPCCCCVGQARCRQRHDLPSDWTDNSPTTPSWSGRPDKSEETATTPGKCLISCGPDWIEISDADAAPAPNEGHMHMFALCNSTHVCHLQAHHTTLVGQCWACLHCC